MTIWQRISQLIIAIAMFCFGLMLLAFKEQAYPVIIAFYCLALVIYGIRMLWYFCSMARYMVGGWGILYRGIIALDFGLFAGSLVTVAHIYILVCLVGTMIFAGVVDILRAMEAKAIQGAWKLKLFQGIVEVAIALLCLIFIRSSDMVVDIFAAGFIFSGIMHFINAFRRRPVIVID